jgi:hypothetical protein
MKMTPVQVVEWDPEIPFAQQVRLRTPFLFFTIAQMPYRSYIIVARIVERASDSEKYVCYEMEGFGAMAKR